MLIAFERPDAAGDAVADKLTLSVLLGPVRSAQVHGALLGAACASLALAIAPGPLTWSEAGWSLALAPLGLGQVRSFGREPDGWLVTGALALFGESALALLVGLA
ncbi:MAG: hypothetical protein OEP52_06840 [Acidimicrobiia bacterium]|nr:hypothetical protein [Acidimicrobiia bacterium]